MALGSHEPERDAGRGEAVLEAVLEAKGVTLRGHRLARRQVSRGQRMLLMPTSPRGRGGNHFPHIVFFVAVRLDPPARWRVGAPSRAR